MCRKKKLSQTGRKEISNNYFVHMTYFNLHAFRLEGNRDFDNKKKSIV